GWLACSCISPPTLMNVIDVRGTGNPSLSAALLIDRVYIDPAARDSTGVTNARIPFSAGTTFTAIELPDPVSVTFCALTVSARKGFEKRSAISESLGTEVSPSFGAEPVR